MTSAFGGQRSIQLSYGCAVVPHYIFTIPRHRLFVFADGEAERSASPDLPQRLLYKSYFSNFY